MTKINKFGKSTFMIAILSFVLVAVLAFGGTYAYFSAVAGRAAGTVKTGHLSLAIDGNDDSLIDAINDLTVASNTIAEPGQLLVGENDTTGKTVTATVNTNIDYYIRVKFEVDVTPGKYELNDETDKMEWKADTSKKHNGVINRDNPLTPDVNEGLDPDEGDETNDHLYDSDNTIDVDHKPGEGDHVLDHISILNIILNVKEGAGAATKWNEYTYEEDPSDDVPVHTGYFYPGTIAATTYTAAEGAPGIAVDKDYQMEVLINIHDWVGAYGCTYYMDAAIEIHFQIEVIQAKYLDNTKLGVSWDDTEGESDTEIDTVKELHDTWNAAIKFDQAAQAALDTPAQQG